MTPTVSSKASTILVLLLLLSRMLCDAKAEWVETAKLTDSDGQAGALFGYSVAIDNGILVVGAWQGYIGGAIFAGTATIFEVSDSEWVAQQKLTSSDADEDDDFGFSVAISNGVVAVGAYGEDDGGSRAGAVYIYEKGAEGMWTERQKLIHSDAAVGDEFGASLAMQGDALIVGARGADSGGGSVFIFTLLNDIWTQLAKLTASDRSADDQFGISVAIDVDTILVGARRDGDWGDRSGSAYVFQREGQSGSWTQHAKLAPTDGQADDEFGTAVAIQGGTVWVSSFNNADGSRVGAVYQFGMEGGGTWTQHNKLVARDFATNDYFGRSLAFRGGTLVAGAFRQDGFTGACYVFQQVSGVWTQSAKLVASDGAASDAFGYAVGVDAGMIIAGAYRDSFNQGSVYVFDWRASETHIRPSVVPAMQPSQHASVHPSATPSIVPQRTGLPNSQPSSVSTVATMLIGVSIGVGTVLLSAVLLFCCYFRSKRKREAAASTTQGSSGSPLQSDIPRNVVVQQDMSTVGDSSVGYPASQHNDQQYERAMDTVSENKHIRRPIDKELLSPDGWSSGPSAAASSLVSDIHSVAAAPSGVAFSEGTSL